MRAALLFALLLVACKGDVGDLCEQQSDCAGELCFAIARTNIRQCSQECPCEEGQKCEGGVYCVVPCTEADQTCPDGLVCYPDNGQCLPVCESDADCTQSGSCVEGMCI